MSNYIIIRNAPTTNVSAVHVVMTGTVLEARYVRFLAFLLLFFPRCLRNGRAISNYAIIRNVPATASALFQTRIGAILTSIVLDSRYVIFFCVFLIVCEMVE